MIVLHKMPYWVKSGLITGIIVTAIVLLLPDKFGNLESVPWYLGWLVMPAFIIFAFLCIIFGVDFVSNYAPNEGPRRLILMTLFNAVSYFIVSFCIGALVAIIIRGGRKIFMGR